jgi:putative membrane protein
MKKLIVFAAATMFALPVVAQSLGERTGINSALGTAPKTEDFIKEAASSDMFEIQSSQLAQQQAADPVKAFASQMIADHQKTTSELKAIASKINVPIPAEMMPAQTSLLDRLNTSGSDFARTYVNEQVTAHKQAVDLFQRYSSGGDNGELKTWAQKTLPALQHHYEMAQQLDRGVNESTSNTAAPRNPAPTSSTSAPTANTGR